MKEKFILLLEVSLELKLSGRDSVAKFTEINAFWKRTPSRSADCCVWYRLIRGYSLRF